METLQAFKGNPGSSGYQRAADDWYVESPAATLALLRAEPIHGRVLDPACGEGRIVDTCRLAGFDAIGSDIADRAGGRFERGDFLARTERVDNIITNPPFALSLAFTEHALQIATRKVVILQQLAWLEGVRRHGRLWRRGLLASVWVFSNRLNIPPGEVVAEPEGQEGVRLVRVQPAAGAVADLAGRLEPRAR